MSNKRKTIAAVKELIALYETGKHVIGNSDTCPLCSIHLIDTAWKRSSCRGCPLADKSGDIGCINFSSFKAAASGNIQIRIEFHKKILPILEKLPPYRFTKKGWKHVAAIKRSW